MKEITGRGRRKEGEQIFLYISLLRLSLVVYLYQINVKQMQELSQQRDMKHMDVLYSMYYAACI